jgi:hypothetical protein
MHSTVYSAIRKSLQEPGFNASAQPCPEGHVMLPVKDSWGNPVCAVCTNKRCRWVGALQPQAKSMPAKQIVPGVPCSIPAGEKVWVMPAARNFKK